VLGDGDSIAIEGDAATDGDATSDGAAVGAVVGG